jgi:uncharacterized protein (TIGR03083 family)
VDLSDVIDILAEECELVSKATLDLSEIDFERPTRCTEWNVKELLAHLNRDLERLPASLPEPSPKDVDVDAVTYWSTYDPVPDAPSISDRSKARAAAYRSGHALARVWDWFWRKVVEDCRAEPPDRLMVTWGPSMRLDEFLKTRVVELGVHGLDLAAALGRDPWLTSGAAGVIRETLEGLLGAEPPGALGWDDVMFIEKGTGRGALTEDERRTLAGAVARFPLLA